MRRGLLAESHARSLDASITPPTRQAPHGASWGLYKGATAWLGKDTRQPAPTDPTLVEATANKSDVIAYMTDRGESEMVVDPRKVKIVNTTVLKPMKTSKGRKPMAK